MGLKSLLSQKTQNTSSKLIVRRARHSSIREGGFSTLESMVAIAILGVALIPLYTFQNTIVSGSSRVEARLIEQQHHALAIEYIRGLVPDGLQLGAATLGGVEVRWSLEPHEQPRDVLASSGVAGRFRLSRVLVRYEVSSPELRQPLRGEVERLTWEQTSSFFSAFSR